MAVYHYEKNIEYDQDATQSRPLNKPRGGNLKRMWFVTSRIFKRKERQSLITYGTCKCQIHFKETSDIILGEQLIRATRERFWLNRKPTNDPPDTRIHSTRDIGNQRIESKERIWGQRKRSLEFFSICRLIRPSCRNLKRIFLKSFLVE